MRTAALALCGALLAVSAAHGATDEEIRKMKLDMMVGTRTIAVMDASIATFKDDGDPGTIEIVFLSKPEDGPSHVSENGEAIFLNGASDKEMQALTDQAFDIRVKRKLAAP